MYHWVAAAIAAVVVADAAAEVAACSHCKETNNTLEKK
jgi:hypothetical protein